MTFLIKVMGLKVESFSSAAAFLSAAPTRFSRLIIDHHMPTMTGLELAKKLRAEGVDMPIMLVSSDLSPDVARRAQSLGIEPISAKPVSLGDLSAFIEGK